MRKLACFILCVCCIPSLHSQEWFWQNPIVTGNALTTVYNVDGQNIIAAGGMSTIIQSQDGGVSWALRHAGADHYLTRINFADSIHGFATGQGALYKTVDGGENWEMVNDDLPTYLRGLHFLDGSIGFGAGSSGMILKTDDGGLNWEELRSGGVVNYSDIWFINEDKGFVCGSSLVWVDPRTTYFTGVLLSTENGGRTWSQKNVNKVDQYESWTAIDFINDTLGFIVGSKGSVLKTTNGGGSWIRSVPHSFVDIHDVKMINDSTAMAFGRSVLMKTTDSGASWRKISIYHALDEYGFHSLCFLNADKWLGVGESGLIGLTTDAGTSWTNISSRGDELTSKLYGIYFVNPHIGYAVGGDPIDPGVILKSSNGGYSWFNVSPDSAATARAVFFLDENYGFVVGDWGMILKTTDGGLTWQFQDSGIQDDIKSVYFTDKENGYACSSRLFYNNSCDILITRNGGETWRSVRPNVTAGMNAIFFVNDSVGFAAGDDDMSDGVIIKTVDHGESWKKWNNQLEYSALSSIHFPSESVGYAVGGNKVVKTDNGGQTWRIMELDSYPGLQSVFFTTDEVGYAVGLSGDIFVTKNGGEDWQELTSPTSNWLSSVFFINEKSGWAVGSGGAIIKTDTGISTGIINDPFPDNQVVIYPNPVNNILQISALGNQTIRQLRIYNLKGELTFQQDILPDSSLDISSLPSGCYFLCVNLGDVTHTKRFIKL